MPMGGVVNFGVPTTPWSRSLLTKINAAGGMTHLGFSAFVQTLIGDANAGAVLSHLGFSTLSAGLPALTTQRAWKQALHLEHVLDVTDFGADPTGVADSTAAIQAAITAAAAGFVVFLPPGIYKTSAHLLVDAKPNVWFRGSGPASVLTLTGDHRGIRIQGASHQCIVSDLAIIGTADVGDTNQIGISAVDSHRCRIERCYVADMGYDGILLECSSAASSEDTLIADNYVENSGDDGINVGSSTAGGTAVAAVRTIVRGNHVTGGANMNDLIHVSFGSADTIVAQNVLVGPAESGVSILSPQGRAMIQGNVIQGVLKGVRRRGYTPPDNEGVLHRVLIQGNEFRACSENHIYLEGTTQGGLAQVAGNWFEEGGTGAADAAMRVEGANVSIVNNHFNFSAATPYGILMSGAGATCHNQVQGNQFVGAGYQPLHLNNSGSVLVTGNTNTVTGTSMRITGASSVNVRIADNDWAGTISDDNLLQNVRFNNLGQSNWPGSFAYNATEDKRHIITGLGGWATAEQIRIQLQPQLSTAIRGHVLEILVAAQSGTAYAGRCAYIDRMELFTLDTAVIRDQVSNTRAISQLVDAEVALSHTGANAIVELIVKHPAAHANTLYHWSIVIRDVAGTSSTGQLEVISAVKEAIP
jgi:hypothetical protein